MDNEIEQRITIGRAAAIDANAGAAVDVLNEDESVLALPSGANLNQDGTVTLMLEYPTTIRTQRPGAPAAIEESFTSMNFRRLKGIDMRKVLEAKGRASSVALALSSGTTEAKIAVLRRRMDASDVSAAGAIVATLCGFITEPGLPDNAVELEGGSIQLPLRYGAAPQGFDPREDLVMRRLTGEDLQMISQAKDTLITAIARATGMTPREAGAVFDVMDAADIMAAQRVIGFLSGNGRMTGR